MILDRVREVVLDRIMIVEVQVGKDIVEDLFLVTAIVTGTVIIITIVDVVLHHHITEETATIREIHTVIGEEEEDTESVIMMIIVRTGNEKGLTDIRVIMD